MLTVLEQALLQPIQQRLRLTSFAEMPAVNLGQALMNFTAQNEGAGKESALARVVEVPYYFQSVYQSAFLL